MERRRLPDDRLCLYQCAGQRDLSALPGNWVSASLKRINVQTRLQRTVAPLCGSHADEFFQ
jgi:hypothetical protein